MFPAEFDYAAPATLAEAVALLERSGGEAKILAGGHSLLPMLKLRLVQTPLLIDIGRIPGLSTIELGDTHLRIGAMATETEIEDSPLVRQHCPLLAETAAGIGDQQVRNRGTIGGSLAHGDPAADMTAAFLALDGTATVLGPGGERMIAAGELFVDMLNTALAPDEVLTSISVPIFGPRTGYPRAGVAYEKFANAASGYALAGVAVVLILDEGGACAEARVAITGAANKASRAAAVEAALRGQRLDDATIAAAAEHAPEGLSLIGDLHADEVYRAHLTKVCTRRALHRAAGRAAIAQ